MSKFHQSKQWIELAKFHKSLMKYEGKWKCYYCSYTGHEMESDHVLPVSKYPECKLWLSNVVLSCETCNKRKGARIYRTPKSLGLLGYYYMVKLLKGLFVGLLIALLIRFVIIDLSRGPWDTAISYQIIHEIIELIRAYPDAVELERHLF